MTTLRGGRYLAPRWDVEPLTAPERIPRTEHEEARRVVRDWLRSRGESDVIEFEGEETA